MKAVTPYFGLFPPAQCRMRLGQTAAFEERQRSIHACDSDAFG